MVRQKGLRRRLHLGPGECAMRHQTAPQVIAAQRNHASRRAKERHGLDLRRNSMTAVSSPWKPSPPSLPHHA